MFSQNLYHTEIFFSMTLMLRVALHYDTGTLGK
jgi:hypothetical protein